MKKKATFLSAILLLVIIFGGLWLENAIAENDQENRDRIRGKLEYIAKFIENDRSEMCYHYGVVFGNILTGATGWGSNSSFDKARNRAYKGCNRHGGGCEELFTINIHNYTHYAVRILLFSPLETDFSESNALFNWEWAPGCGKNLGIIGGHLFVSKDFYLKIISTRSGGFYWGEERIANFGIAQNNYRNGRNLSIKLVDR